MIYNITVNQWFALLSSILSVFGRFIEILFSFEFFSKTHLYSEMCWFAVQVQCEQCGKMVLAARLSIHLKIHSGVKSHLCELCGRTFTLKAYLNAHIRINHRGIFTVPWILILPLLYIHFTSFNWLVFYLFKRMLIYCFFPCLECFCCALKMTNWVHMTLKIGYWILISWIYRLFEKNGKLIC